MNSPIPTTRVAKEGTQYLYTIKYRDDGDPGCPEFTARSWAYSVEHALEKFSEAADAEGWEVTAIARVPESGLMHEAKWQKVTP